MTGSTVGAMDTMTLHRSAADGTPALPRATTGQADPAAPRRLQRLWRGHDGDPSWARPALLGLLLATALFYLYDLTSSGYANSFYSAAVQAGSTSWKAFFYGSSDAGNSITVDKPPASLWVMALSVRVLGLSSFAILAARGAHGRGHRRRRATRPSVATSALRPAWSAGSSWP